MVEEQSGELSSKWKFYNVIILGLGFFLLFTAFQTTANVQTTTISVFFSTSCNSSTPLPFANSLGFYSLCIIYFFLAVFTWLSPPITGLIGEKWSLFICGALYCIQIAILIHPFVETVFIASALLGAAGGVLWTAQGKVLFDNSDKDTIGRNSGIFWFMLQCSLIVGNTFYFLFVKLYLQLQTQTDSETICIPYLANAMIFAVLTLLGILGVLTYLLLRPAKKKNQKETKGREQEREPSPPAVSDSKPLINEAQGSLTDTEAGDPSAAAITGNALERRAQLFKQAWKDFIRSFQLMVTLKMALLMVTFIYTGVELTFWSGVYGTLVVRTLQHPEYVGLVGLMVGIGEISGGAIFGIFGKRTRRFGRDPIVVLGMLLHMVCFLLIFYTIPSDATLVLHPEDQSHLIHSTEAQLGISLTVAFLLGFGDSCFNTQIYSILGDVYKGRDGAPAMAIFKFFQSIAACVAFLYNGHMALTWQLLLLVVFGVAGTVCFVLAEWITGVAAPADHGQPNKKE